MQTIGRAARHLEGKVIMYADHITESMERAIRETTRRRAIQQAYNQKHHIQPKSIAKEVGLGLRAIIPEKQAEDKLNLKKVPPEEIPSLLKELNSEMQLAAANLDFEKAADLRDLIAQIKNNQS